MRWLYGWLAIGHWKLLKPSAVTSKDSKVGEDHEPIPKFRVRVGLGLALGLSPRPVLEVNLGIRQGLIAKAATMVTHKAYVLSPLMDPLLEGE